MDDTYDDEFLDCELCSDEPDPYPHCCGCGADGSSQRPDCTCQ